MKIKPRKYWARLRLWWLFDYCLWHQERNFTGGDSARSADASAATT